MLVECEGEETRAIITLGVALTFADWLHCAEEVPEGFAESKTARVHWQRGDPVQWALSDFVSYNLRE